MAARMQANRCRTPRSLNARTAASSLLRVSHVWPNSSRMITRCGPGRWTQLNPKASYTSRDQQRRPGLSTRSCKRSTFDGNGTVKAREVDRRTHQRIGDPLAAMFDADEEAGKQPDTFVLGPFSLTHNLASSADRGGVPRPWTARAPADRLACHRSQDAHRCRARLRHPPRTDDGCHHRTNPRRTDRGLDKRHAPAVAGIPLTFEQRRQVLQVSRSHWPSVHAHAHGPQATATTERRAITAVPAAFRRATKTVGGSDDQSPTRLATATTTIALVSRMPLHRTGGRPLGRGTPPSSPPINSTVAAYLDASRLLTHVLAQVPATTRPFALCCSPGAGTTRPLPTRPAEAGPITAGVHPSAGLRGPWEVPGFALPGVCLRGFPGPGQIRSSRSMTSSSNCTRSAPRSASSSSINITPTIGVERQRCAAARPAPPPPAAHPAPGTALSYFPAGNSA